MNQKFNPILVNAHDLLAKAFANKYAVAQININNFEWIKTVLTTVKNMNAPVILGVSEGAVKYMCGYHNVVAMVVETMKNLDVTTPVVLHLDHGTYEGCMKALDAGFSSIMFDGSHLAFEENLVKAKEVITKAKNMNVSVEVEVGTIGGEEDGVAAAGELANLEQCIAMGKLDISMLAAGIGNIHGVYPENWEGLSFTTLQKITDAVKKPLVLHGGSGIPDQQIQKAIALGIAKINVNTELQLAFAAGLRQYFEAKKDLMAKGFDPRKVLQAGCEKMTDVIKTKITLFGSNNKA